MVTGNGNDLLVGDFESAFSGIGKDTLCGGLGNDTLIGGGGNSILYGSEGNDFLPSIGNGKVVQLL